jgi:hypothetical protein
MRGRLSRVGCNDVLNGGARASRERPHAGLTPRPTTDGRHGS